MLAALLSLYASLMPVTEAKTPFAGALVVPKAAQELKLVSMSEEYSITLPCDKALPEKIAAGRYGRVNPVLYTVTPPPCSGSREVTVALVELTSGGRVEDLRSFLRKNELVPASLDHLLAFGATYPALQRTYRIYALNGAVERPDAQGMGVMYVPSLSFDRDRKQRVLSLGRAGLAQYEVGIALTPQTRFLVVVHTR